MITETLAMRMSHGCIDADAFTEKRLKFLVKRSGIHERKSIKISTVKVM